MSSEGKTPALESKNGKKGGGQEGSKHSRLSWFLVLALLGVWSSMAVVYFDIVDYDSVIGKENISLYIYKSGNICKK